MAEEQNPLLDPSLWGTGSQPKATQDNNNPLLDDSLWDTGPIANVSTNNEPFEEPIKNWAETPDASTLSAGQIALNTAKNIIPSAGRAGVGLYHAVRHLNETGKVLWQLGALALIQN